MKNPVQLRPDYSGTNNITPMIRAITGLARDHDTDAAGLIAKTWPGDRQALEFAERGAVVPTGVGGTASVLASSALNDLISLIGPTSSAFGFLATRAVKVGFKNSAASEFVAGIPTSPDGIAFIAPGQPIPVGMLSIGGVTVSPHKIGFITTLTEEAINSSNAETLVKLALREKIKLGAETLLLDNIETDGIRPSGWRFGTAAIAASAAGVTAMVSDLAKIGGAVAGVAGSLNDIVFIGDPVSALAVAIAIPDFKFPFLASAGLPAKTILAVAANNIVFGGGDEIKFSTSKESALHESTTPTGIDGANPVRSLFQTQCVGIRLTFDVSWALRSPGGIAWITGVTW